MKKIAATLIFILLVCKVHSTNQVKDIIIMNGDKLFLYESPLEQIDSITQRIADKIYEQYDEINLSSDCWRGFEAKWIIINNFLYLSEVTECNTGRLINAIVEEIFNRKFQKGLMKADWVSGVFWAGKGSVPSGVYISVFEQEYKFNINNGEIKNLDIYKYKPCDYNSEDSLYRFIYSTIEWTKIKSDKLVANISVYLRTDTDGVINYAKIESSTNKGFNNEILRVIKMIPCRNVYYNMGKFWDIGETLYLIIDKNDEKKYVR